MARLKAIVIVLLLTLSALAVVAPAASADPAPMAGTKRVVLGELFTGAWCGFCPFAASAMRTMQSNYERSEVVILAWHIDDILEVPEGATRDAWYGVPGYPTAYFDGVVDEVGGSTGTYNAYVNAYNQRAAKASDFRITVEGDISDTTGTGDVWINITCVQTPTIANLKLHTVVFEDDYGPYNGGNGETIHDFVAWEMIEGTDGTTITASAGDVKRFHYSIDASQYAQDFDQLGVIAFVQSHSTKEVLQAAYINVPVLPNVPPVLSQGQASPLSCTEDESVTFKVWYRDPDDRKNKGPGAKKVFVRNGTEAAVEHELSVVSSSDPWTVGKWLAWTSKLLPGSYTYRFNVTDGEDWATGDVEWNATTVLVRPRNKLPELMAATHAPLSGDTATTFRFDVMYRDLDNEAPTAMTITIDDVDHAMVTDTPEGPWNDWVTFYYTTTLGVGDMHRYFYSSSDGIDPVRLPKATDVPNFYRGPEVLPPNFAPTLTGERSTPATGTRATEFTFTVTYTDGEDDRATVSTVYIDNEPEFMMPTGSNFKYGVVYRFDSKLSLGSHMYYFVFSDGKHDVRYPTAGAFDGPTVSNLAPEAVITAPKDGNRYTPTEFVPFDGLDSTDPEGDVLTYKWVSDLDGDLGTDSAFDVRLSEGTHTITLTVADPFGGTASASIELDVRPYLPHLVVMDMSTSVNAPVERDMVRITAIIGNDGELRATAADVSILIDGAEVYTDTVSVDIGGEREVYYGWTCTVGEHTLKVDAGTESMEITVVVKANSLPVVEGFIYDPVPGQAVYRTDAEVFFKLNATDANKDALTFEWDFGDGTPVSNQREPSHLFTQPGPYTVTVKVTDARGGVTTRTIDVVIQSPPKEDSPGLGAACAMAALAAVGAVAAAAPRRRRRA